VSSRLTRARTLGAELGAWIGQTLRDVRSKQYPLVEYQRDPVRYVRERLRVAIVMPHQAAILEALAAGVAGKAHPRVAVRSGQKSGKTAVAVWAALWFYECFEGAIVLMSAAIESQTRNVLWKELSDTIRRAQTAGATIDGQQSKSPATGLTSSDASRSIRGVSGRDIEALAGVSGRQLMIVDEASHLPEGKAQVFAGNQMGGGGAQLLISNPTANAGPFYDAFHAMAPWWQTFHVDCEKVADWQVANDVRIPYTTSREKIEEARAMYGEDSPFWSWRVKGDFLRNEAGRAMPMVRIEAAIARWSEPLGEEKDALSIGWDIAGDGIDADENAWAFRRGRKCLGIERRRGLREEAALALTYEFLRAYRRPGEVPTLVIDAEGPIGSAYYGRARGEAEHRALRAPESLFNVYGVRASSRFVRDKTKFDRVRDELIWTLSQWLVEGAIPNDPKLQAELYEPKWEPNANNKLVATPKHAIREKLGRSPDSLDALALSVRGPTVFLEDTQAAGQPAIDVYAQPAERTFDPFASVDWQRRRG
jgi:phage terminase large subunit